MYDGYEEDQILKPGDKYLSRKRYEDAIEAYKAVLEQDPRDFLALRGLMLAAAKIRKPDELSYIHSEGTEDFTYDFDLALEVIEKSSEEDKKFFADLEKIYSDMKRLSDCKEEIDSLGNDKTRTEAYIKHNEKLRRRQYIRTKTWPRHPREIFVSSWISCAFVILSAIIIIIYFKPDVSMTAMLLVSFAIILGGLVAYNIFFVYPRIKKVNEFGQKIAELKAESLSIDEKIKSLRAEVEKLTDSIGPAIDDFAMRDMRMMMHGYGKEQI